jgi:hypothetical protein
MWDPVPSEYKLRCHRLAVRRQDIPWMPLTYALVYRQILTDKTHHIVAVYWDQFQVLVLQSPRSQRGIAHVRVMRPVRQVRTAVCIEGGPRNARHSARPVQKARKIAHVQSVAHRVPASEGIPQNLSEIPCTVDYINSYPTFWKQLP